MNRDKHKIKEITEPYFEEQKEIHNKKPKTLAEAVKTLSKVVRRGKSKN